MRTIALLLLLLFTLGTLGCDDDCPSCPEVQPPDPETGAGTRRVPEDHPTLAAALAAAAVGDTLLIAGGTHAAVDLDLKPGLVIRGTGTDNAPTILDADGQGRIFRCEGLDSLVVLENLTLTGGYLEGSIDSRGAAIWCRQSSLRLVDCAIVDNLTATHDGAGIGASSAELELVRCRFEDNASGYYGGGLWSDAWSTLLVSDCRFLRNSAVRGGGGVAIQGALELRGCLFEDNDDGGAKLGNGALVSQCTFRGNRDRGLDLGRDCRVENCLFIDNVGYDGGAGLRGGNNLEFHDSLFIGNRCLGGDGGGARVYGDSLLVTGCGFLANEAVGGGGGLKAENAVIESTTFRDNRAHEGGGLLAQELDLIDCDLVGNHADFGAAVRCWLGRFDGCVVVQNAGRGWIVRTGTASQFERCTVAANTVEAEYGLFRLGYPADPSQFAACIVAFNDGVPFTDESVTPMLEYCDLFGNSGGDWTGGIADQAGQAGNLSLDPLFCDLSMADVSLCADSPCLPTPGGPDRIVGARDHGCVSCGD